MVRERESENPCRTVCSSRAQITFYQRVVTVWRMTGRHTGRFLGVPATARPVDLKGIDVGRVRGDRISEHHRVERSLRAVRQEVPGTGARA